MPFVLGYYKADEISAEDLKIAYRELVPAALHSPMGPLTPGSIKARIKKQTEEDDINVGVFTKVEAYDLPDRAENLQERAEMLEAALDELFPGVGFGVWACLVKAGWASETADPEFDGDMSMDAAIARTRVLLAASPLDCKLLVYKQTGEWQANIMQWQAQRIGDELGIRMIDIVRRLQELSDGKCRVISGR
jgi:hypothetical protein